MNLEAGDRMELDQGLVDYLARYITPHKRAAIERVLRQRTRFFTVVLEDIFKPHNVPVQCFAPVIVLAFRTFT